MSDWSPSQHELERRRVRSRLRIRSAAIATAMTVAVFAALREDGTLAAIEQQWLSDVVDVPTLQ